jgi:hypothetical protein
MVECIIAEKSQRNLNEKPWWWLSGNTYPHRLLLKQQGARFSSKRRAWYYIGWELPASIRQLLAPELESLSVPVEIDDTLASSHRIEASSAVNVYPTDVVPTSGIAARHEGASSAAPHFVGDRHNNVLIPTDEKAFKPDESPAAKAAAVRVIKPSPMPPNGDPLDAVQSAIQEVKALPPMPQVMSMLVGNGHLLRINQAYCGELTGSISGQVFCYGYAIHDGVCVYVNMGGPRTSVEAIRAKLGKGDIVTLVPDDAPAIDLTAGEGSSGMYTDYLQTIPEARFTSLILLHEWIVNPNDDAKTTFLLRVSDTQAKAKLKHRVAQLVNIPVFDAWTEFLWSAGRAAALIHSTHSSDGIDLLTMSLDADAWTRLLTGGIEQQIIQLPETH